MALEDTAIQVVGVDGRHLLYSWGAYREGGGRGNHTQYHARGGYTNGYEGTGSARHMECILIVNLRFVSCVQLHRWWRAFVPFTTIMLPKV